MTNNSFSQTTLDAIADFTNGGAWNQTEYSDEGVPVVRVTDIKNETVDLTACKFLPKSSFEKYFRHRLRKGDLVICTVGSHPTQPGSVVGRAAIIPASADGALLNQNAVCIRSSSPDIDQRWLGYLGRSQEFHEYIISCARGSASQVRMAIGLLKVMPVVVPPLPVQQRIAGILSAYDELIENSQRRIKILESMARTLYREWFVHFRFPGHENVHRITSPLGEIPQGWEVKKLGNISSYINRGITPRYDEEGDSVVINQRCVRDQRLNLEPARRQSKAIPSEKQICFGDVLINSTGVGTLGRVAQVYECPEKCTIDTHVTISRAASHIDLDFYGCCLLSLQETFERLGTGATGQTELGRAAIADIDLVVPPTVLQCQFGSAVKGMRSAAETYSKQIKNLRRTRDLLLPRLLSGQIDVETSA
ncbi:restriction endonuclease subunit S [Pseudomonas sp. G(2018)]|uniref:restriction endonuclease subunit S n=1 Tax=Pseudomonas sp. G(2018) TaxID=2502242 RepID=UPI0010F97B8F|nr:restriction endonuclease subunit S [Pseudomonas sp. G(2018)]